MFGCLLRPHIEMNGEMIKLILFLYYLSNKITKSTTMQNTKYTKMTVTMQKTKTEGVTPQHIHDGGKTNTSGRSKYHPTTHL